MPPSRWKHLDGEAFGLASRVSAKILAHETVRPLTDIRYGRELLVACDIGGSHQSSEYESFSFLVSAVSGSQKWEDERQVVRKDLLRDSRRMSYKSLGDQVRAHALLPFLNAADLLPGLLATFLVDRNISRLICDHSLPNYFPELIVAERGWNQRAFHRLLLVASLGSLLVNGLSEQSQDLLWITDQDEIAPNPKKHDHAGHVIHHHISTYAPRNYGTLVFITTEADRVPEASRRFEDVVAICDLAAGALAEVLSKLRQVGHQFGSKLWIPIPGNVSNKAWTILRWFGKEGLPLRRIAIVLNANTAGGARPEEFCVARAPSLWLPGHQSKPSLVAT